MDCPGCRTTLENIEYEGVPVRRCGQCRGMLVTRSGVQRVRTQQNRPTEQLFVEYRQEDREDTQEKIRCPRCRNRMRKQLVRHVAEQFTIDSCRECQLSWFDGGELARIQLIYESSAAARDSIELQYQARNMSDERRRQLEEDIANLPSLAPTLSSIFGGLFSDEDEDE